MTDMLDDVINKDDIFVEDSTVFGELDDTQIMLTHLLVNQDLFHAWWPILFSLFLGRTWMSGGEIYVFYYLLDWRYWLVIDY